MNQSVNFADENVTNGTMFLQFTAINLLLLSSKRSF